MKAYILSVCGAALLCAVTTRFLPQKGGSGGIGKIVLGVFLVLVTLRPVSDLYFDELQYITADVEAEALQAVHRGEESTRESLVQIIKERTTTYILQKAHSLQLDIDVEVVLSDDPIPVPQKVFITGHAAPYARQHLQSCITQDLGIPKENQRWT